MKSGGGGKDTGDARFRLAKTRCSCENDGQARSGVQQQEHLWQVGLLRTSSRRSMCYEMKHLRWQQEREGGESQISTADKNSFKKKSKCGHNQASYLHGNQIISPAPIM